MRHKNHLSINHICLFLGVVLLMATIGISIAVLWITGNVVATFCKDCPEKTGLIFRPAL